MAERRDDTATSTTSMEVVADREIRIARTFRAPARLVFDAWTRADLVSRWWAPKSRGTVVACAADVRVGGKYRYVMRRGDGVEMAFSGEYTEVNAPERLVYTQHFEPIPGPPVVVTVTFEEQGGSTRLVAREVYPSKAVRDGVLSTGMEHGMRESMDQLDLLVASLQ